MRLAPAIILVCGLAFAGQANPMQAQESFPAQNGDSLANAARLMVRVQNQPALTGEFRIAPDGTISLPVIGRISVTDKSLVEIEDEISAKLASLGGKDGRAAVEIGEYRNVYISGLVAKPGAYSWEPGLTIAQAFAVAGGLYRAPELGTARALQTLTERRKTVNDRKYALANLTRLEAERDGLTELKLPPELVALAGPDEAQRILATQRALLTSRRSAIEEQLETLKQGALLAERELKGLQEQDQRIAQQLAARKKSSAAIESLEVKGYVSAERGLEQKLRLLELEEKATNVTVAIARVQASVAELRRQSADVKRTRAAEIESRIVDLQRDLAQTGIDLDAAEVDGPIDAKRSGAASSIRYQLIRGNAEPADVTATTSLQPGDVVVVARDGSSDLTP